MVYLFITMKNIVMASSVMIAHQANKFYNPKYLSTHTKSKAIMCNI
jgi:hypothetical protein